MKDVKKRLVWCFDVRDMPPEVEEECVERDFSTHYENSLNLIFTKGVTVEEAETPLIAWLKEQGVKPDDGDKQGILYFGIFAT